MYASLVSTTLCYLWSSCLIHSLTPLPLPLLKSPEVVPGNHATGSQPNGYPIKAGISTSSYLADPFKSHLPGMMLCWTQSISKVAIIIWLGWI